jgi:hypothetical protein
VEWNEVIGPGSQMFRVLPDCSRKQCDCQLERFIPAKTRRRVRALMRDTHVLMRDVGGKISWAGDVPQLVLADAAVLPMRECKEQVDGERRDVLT